MPDFTPPPEPPVSGYCNQSTALIAEWIGNTRNVNGAPLVFRAVQQKVKILRKQAPAAEEVASGIWDESKYLFYKLADDLKEWVDRLVVDDPPIYEVRVYAPINNSNHDKPGLVGVLINAGFGRVNWTEVVHQWLYEAGIFGVPGEHPNESEWENETFCNYATASVARWISNDQPALQYFDGFLVATTNPADVAHGVKRFVTALTSTFRVKRTSAAHSFDGYFLVRGLVKCGLDRVNWDELAAWLILRHEENLRYG